MTKLFITPENSQNLQIRSIEFLSTVKLQENFVFFWDMAKLSWYKAKQRCASWKSNISIQFSIWQTGWSFHHARQTKYRERSWNSIPNNNKKMSDIKRWAFDKQTSSRSMTASVQKWPSLRERPPPSFMCDFLIPMGTIGSGDLIDVLWYIHTTYTPFFVLCVI